MSDSRLNRPHDRREREAEARLRNVLARLERRVEWAGAVMRGDSREEDRSLSAT